MRGSCKFKIYRGGELNKEVHVHSIFEAREHDLDGLDCWCAPYVEVDYRHAGGDVVIVHRLLN